MDNSYRNSPRDIFPNIIDKLTKMSFSHKRAKNSEFVQYNKRERSMTGLSLMKNFILYERCWNKC